MGPDERAVLLATIAVLMLTVLALLGVLGRTVLLDRDVGARAACTAERASDGGGR